jgi:ribosome-associated protein
MSYRYSKTKIDWFIKEIRFKEIDLWSAKSSWPWGQHVNKTESKVQLFRAVNNTQILPDVYKKRFIELRNKQINDDWILRIDTQVHKSQADNKEQTRKKLASMINAAFKPPKAPRKMTKPPKHAIDARIAEKKRRSKTRAIRTPLKFIS